MQRPKKERRLPEVLSEEEVVSILNAIDNLKHKAILTLIYSAGLRLGELVNLRINDIDSKRMVVVIRQGKGKKDRISHFSEKVLHLLREYLLERGTDLRYIQALLGQKNPKTTEIYTHITKKGMEKIKSPFDNLDI